MGRSQQVANRCTHHYEHLATCLLLAIGSMILASAIATTALAQQSQRIACWNVENLFDTLPNPQAHDLDFTPQGEYNWNGHRYWYKLGQISRTIAGMGGASPCMAVGLVEVENDSVLYDLTHRTSLARLGYSFIASHGPDARGINVGLLYQPMLFSPISHDSIRVAPPKGVRATRDVLHVSGRIQSGDTLDLFIVHLPSRRGGADAQKYRDKVAERLSHVADSVAAQRQSPMLLIMGDFNAEPTDRIFRKFLPHYNLLTRNLAGTYRFQGEWSQIDHFVAHPHLGERFSLTPSVHRAPYLLKDTKTGPTPLRTYLGTHYQGGLSDHLPIVVDMENKN